MHLVTVLPPDGIPSDQNTWFDPLSAKSSSPPDTFRQNGGTDNLRTGRGENFLFLLLQGWTKGGRPRQWKERRPLLSGNVYEGIYSLPFTSFTSIRCSNLSWRRWVKPTSLLHEFHTILKKEICNVEYILTQAFFIQQGESTIHETTLHLRPSDISKSIFLNRDAFGGVRFDLTSRFENWQELYVSYWP